MSGGPGRGAQELRTETATASPDLAHEARGLLSVTEASEPRSLNELVAHAARHVPACSGAGAVLWRGGEPAVLAATHPSLPELTEVQVSSGRGPALDALSRGEPVGCSDTLEEQRWPEYASAALRLGVRCSLSLAYRTGADIVSLSLFGARPRTLEADSVAMAERLVALGGAAMGVAYGYGEAQRTARQLRDAAESRALVDQAKGVLMHALGCSADEALQRMRQISQARNMKVTEVATTIINARGADALGRLATHQGHGDRK
jgi:ANTAR domain-containing protein